MKIIIKKNNTTLLSENNSVLLTEGLKDIGLSEREQNKIVETLSNTSEQTNTWFARFLKELIVLPVPTPEAEGQPGANQAVIVSRLFDRIQELIAEEVNAESARERLKPENSKIVATMVDILRTLRPSSVSANSYRSTKK